MTSINTDEIENDNINDNDFIEDDDNEEEEEELSSTGETYLYGPSLTFQPVLSTRGKCITKIQGGIGDNLYAITEEGDIIDMTCVEKNNNKKIRRKNQFKNYFKGNLLYI